MIWVVTYLNFLGDKTSSSAHRSRASSEHSDDSRGERSTQRLERVERIRDGCERNVVSRNAATGKLPLISRDKKTLLSSTNTESPLLLPLVQPSKRRCRNFDERGFCIYGDRCKYEHGTDALVVPGTSAAFFSNAAGFMDSALVSGACLLPKPKEDDDFVAGSGKISNLTELTSQQLQPSKLEGESFMPVYTPTPSKLAS